MCFSIPKWKIISSRELRRGESDEDMHSCIPTLVELDFVETKLVASLGLLATRNLNTARKGLSLHDGIPMRT